MSEHQIIETVFYNCPICGTRFNLKNKAEACLATCEQVEEPTKKLRKLLEESPVVYIFANDCPVRVLLTHGTEKGIFFKGQEPGFGLGFKTSTWANFDRCMQLPYADYRFELMAAEKAWLNARQSYLLQAVHIKQAEMVTYQKELDEIHRQLLAQTAIVVSNPLDSWNT